MDLLDNDDQPDTLPGFKMQSEHFVLKFITGLQKGVCRLRKSNLNLDFLFLNSHLQQVAGVRDGLVRHDGDLVEQVGGRARQPAQVPGSLVVPSTLRVHFLVLR